MTINSFSGRHRFLSNFWPCKIRYGNLVYPSVEHAYQAAKTLNRDSKQEIALVRNPGLVKHMGGRLRLRPDWPEVKLEIMRDLTIIKYSDRELQENLLSTGDKELIEGNYWGDTYWGVCRGTGENHLGIILMEVREIYKVRKESFKINLT